MTINVTRSSMPDFEEYCNEIKELWESRWLTNMGAKHNAFEKELKDYLKTPCASLFTNGHLALEAVIQAMDLKGEIITTPFTFASTTHAIVRCGCTPVFCDIDPVNFTMDPGKIEALITDKTVAIMPVHVYGNLCDTEAIDVIAKKHGLKVIYDAAHAFGVFKDGVSSACFGDAAMFSFHATKVFHTIEGGCLTYADESLTAKLNLCKNFGITGPEDVVYAGGNAKLNEFCAAMGLCNLRHVDGEIAKRKAANDRYYQHLSSVPGLRLNPVIPGVKQNYAYFPVVFEDYKYNRDEIFDMLAREGIVARKYFYPLTNSFECFRGLPGFDVKDTPIAHRIASQVLTLPMYADLSLEDVDRICEIILR